MKNLKIPFLVTIFFMSFLISCDEDIPQNVAFEAYTFAANPDINAGDWKAILLTSNEQIAIAAPNDVTSAEYKAELTNLKNTISNLSGDQKNIVQYWTNNPILRWNEISRELSAKYNLAPAPNADGSYPAPNAATPDKYPLFPFAHPPYSCRAFAYLAVAQFDALISCWHYKFKYNRTEPVLNDGSITPLLPNANIPSYPSDGATIASVSQAMLTALFPLEKEYLIKKGDECRSAFIWAGLNVQSDIDAGKLLGEEVAKVALARAKTDGMGAAQTPKPISDSLKQLAFNTFGWSWTNQEIPPRPVGITPYFGKVKTWAVSNIEAIRPPVPPKPGSAEFNAAADELRKISDDLTTEQRKIANWWADGLGTDTPPGHWNRFACDQISSAKLSPVRSARVLAYMNMAIQDAGIACWDAKYFYHYPRPIQTMPGFKTILGTPSFPSYVSGHSTFSSAAAEVLSHFFPSQAVTFNAYALEASNSRIFAGIHYRFDCVAGLDLGKKVAEATLAIAKVDGGE
ncbi:MAG: phosphatase PAP2 family protein [Saprospiraceae bacterium]|nr:phosphatase PAP2 family protein [Saprospiraceae bacterium]